MRGLPFERRVEALLADRSDVAPIVRPMLAAWRQLREQIATFDKVVRVLVRASPTCRLLMSVPGIGAVSVLAYVSTVEDPGRFARSRAVGAHLGLTPRQYQSGEVDRSGRISRCGDTLARTLLYEAAVVILHRVKRACSLKDWALAIAKRSGMGKARVALARKLSVILHSVWRSGEPFRWSEQAASRMTGTSRDPSTIPAVVMRCPSGEGTGGCEGGRWATCTSTQARCGHCSTCASDQMLRRLGRPRREP